MNTFDFRLFGMWVIRNRFKLVYIIKSSLTVDFTIKVESKLNYPASEGVAGVRS